MKNKRCFSVLSNDKKMETVDHLGTVVHQDQSRNENFKDLTYIKKKKSYVTVLQSSDVSYKKNQSKSINRKELFNSTMERINAKTQIKRISLEKQGSSISSNNKSLNKGKKNTKTALINQSILSRAKCPEKMSDETSFEVVTADYR